MNGTRYLIVNADDFGQTPSINRGVIEAHEHGIVTSASLMVRWPAAPEAAAYARANPALSVGLHIDLGEWACGGSNWVPIYQVVPEGDVNAVKEEVSRQVVAFRQLLRGDPTHLDSHQHLHQQEPLRSITIEVAQQIGIPLRHCTPGLVYNGSFYGQGTRGTSYPEAITVEGLIHLLRRLPPGFTELLCHPAATPDLNSMYREERVAELRTLCDPRVRDALAEQEIQLCSFREFPASLHVPVSSLRNVISSERP